MGNDEHQAEVSPIVKQALEAAAQLPDIPKDFDDMSSEDWTALNEWVRKTGEIYSSQATSSASAGEGDCMPSPPDFPDDVDEMSSEDWTEAEAWLAQRRAWLAAQDAKAKSNS